jgi:hypothetical protein
MCIVMLNARGHPVGCNDTFVEALGPLSECVSQPGRQLSHSDSINMPVHII